MSILGFSVRRRLALAVSVVAGCTPLFPSVASAEPPGAKRLSAIEVLIEERGLVVSLAGDGRLTPSSIHEVEYWPPRLVVELPEVASWVPGITSVGAGPVEDIRVVVHSLELLVTRVVFELRRTTTYEIDESADGGRLLTFIFPLGPAPSDLSQDAQDDQDQNQNQNARAEAPGDPGPRLVLARAVLEPAAARSVPSWTYGRRSAPRAVLSARAAMPVELGMPLGPAATSSRLGLRAVRSQPSAIRGTDAFTLSSAFPLVATAEHELSPIRLSTWRLSDGPPLVALADAVVGVPLTVEVTPFGRFDTLAPERRATPAGVAHTATGRSTLIRPSPVLTAPTTQLQQITQGTPREYSGDPVSMDFQGADLRAVLRTFAEISGLNVVIDPR